MAFCFWLGLFVGLCKGFYVIVDFTFLLFRGG